MKIKVQPADFIVEEITTIPQLRHGPYTLVKLVKQYWNTLDAIELLSRHASIPRRDIARAGLKDRYSHSVQYLTIKGRFNSTMQTENVHVSPVGYTHHRMSPAFLHRNRFTVTLRDCSPQDLSRIAKNAPSIRKNGIVNYFDEQRFGSARHEKGFFAKLLIKHHYNGALKLLLCYPHKNDKKQERHFKHFCLEHWGHWKDCIAIAPSKYRKLLGSLIEYPRDPRRAIKTVDREFLNLYLLAYQSFLFNEVMSAYIESLEPEPIRIPYNMGMFVFFKDRPMNSFSPRMKIPMLNEKSILNRCIRPIVQSVMDREGIKLKDLALSKMRFRGVRFRSSVRHVLIIPDRFTIGKPHADDLYPKHKKIIITFDLPPGSYATLLIKRLMG